MIALYCALWLAEFAFFGLQRTLLLLAREHSAEFKHVAPLLPGWFGVSWLAAIGKWAALGMIAWTQGIWLALAIGAVAFVLSAVLPVPHRLYRPLLRKQAQVVARVSPEYGMRLTQMLEESRMFGG